MRLLHSSQKLIFLTCLLCTVHGNPLRAVPAAKRDKQQSADKTLVTTTTDQGSTYTLTYAPSTVTADTTLVEGSSTSSVHAGAIVGALLGGAALAALPFAIPKAIPANVLDGEPVDGGGEGGDDEPECQKKTANICTEECTATWFISTMQLQTTSTCAAAACAKTTGCGVADTTKTNSHPVPTPSTVVTVSTTADSENPSAPPLDYLVIQAYLGQEYQRLHIDDNGGTANNDAECATDTSKGILDAEGVKDDIAGFCKDQKDTTASPNFAITRTYDQDENRMQAVLRVSYTGDRGEGATYTLSDEKKCNDLFSKILTCGPDKDHITGGNITSEKGVFTIEPYMYPGALGCAAADYPYGAVASNSLSNVDDFCSKFEGQRINQGESKEVTYPQPVGGLHNTLTVRWHPETVGCEEGGLYDHGYPINKAACKRFLSQTINDCNKGDDKFKAGGTNLDQCAWYQIFVGSDETVVCGTSPRWSEEQRNSFKAFDPAVAHGAIDDFCGKNLLADPNAKDTSYGFSQDGTWPKGIARGGKDGISIQVSFVTHDDVGDLCPEGSQPNKAFNTGGDECQRRLGKMIVDGCDPNGEKHGGFVVDPSYNGCVQWQVGVFAYPGD